MSLSTPSDEVQLRMEALRIQSEIDEAKRIEQARIHAQTKLKQEKVKAEKQRQALIDVEAQMRLQIASWGDTKKEDIKNKLKSKLSAGEICDAILGKPFPGSRWKTIDSLHQMSIGKKREILTEYILKNNDECIAEEKAAQERLRLERLEKLRQDIDKANKALPKHKLNGGVYAEERRQIDFISNQYVSTPLNGLSYETIYLYGQRNAWERIDKRASLTITTEWNDDYSKGILPFLTQCPSCKKQNTIYFKPSGARDDSGAYYSSIINTVECSTHYKWDGSKHYKCIVHSPSYHQWVEWDPKDPDGSKAAEAKRLVDIADLEAQVAALQLKIADLKRV